MQDYFSVSKDNSLTYRTFKLNTINTCIQIVYKFAIIAREKFKNLANLDIIVLQRKSKTVGFCKVINETSINI